MTALRSAAIALAFLAAAGDVRAQAPSQEQLKKHLDEKLEAEFLKKTKWILDLDEAKSAAKKDSKLIFAYFTRSYAN